MYTNGIGITTIDHKWSIKNDYLPCNILDWFETQYEYGGSYDSCEIVGNKYVELKDMNSLESLMTALGEDASEELYIDFRGKFGDLGELGELLKGSEAEDKAVKERLCAFVITCHS